MLRQQAKSAVIWSGVDILMRRGLQFGISVVLARLLTPEDFGTVALLFLFTGVASVFVDTGFSSALIQRQDVTHTDESTVFWFNLSMGAVAGLALWAAAPAIANFYAVPVLKPLTAIMALNIFLGSLGSIHSTLLTKNLNFRIQMIIGAVATLSSGVCAIFLALHGAGVWALAFQALAATIVTTSLLWLVNPWRPARTFSGATVRKLFGFGGYMLASGLLSIFYDRGYTLLIGKLYGVASLGYYNRADTTVRLQADVLTSILSRVTFPLLSAIAEDRDKLRRTTRQIVKGAMLVNVPALLGLSAVAKPLTLVLFGSAWLPIVPLLQVLCLSGVLWPLHVINLTVLMAQGHSNLFFRVEVAKKILGVSLMVAGSYFGVMGIAWSQVVYGILGFAINAHYTRRYLEYGPVSQTLDVLPIFAAGLFMWLVLWRIDLLPAANPLLQLTGTAALGACLFISVVWAFRIEPSRDVIGFLLPKKSE
jgi:O-antigen/teichoic acid export membrane protein